MAIFEIEADGKVFEVDAPDQATAIAAFKSAMDAAPGNVAEPSPAYTEALGAGSAATLQGEVPQMGEWERAMLLPMETNTRTGERRPATPGLITGIANSAVDMFTLPGDTLAGRYDEELDPRLRIAPTPELIGRGLNFGANSIGWGDNVVTMPSRVGEKTATGLPKGVDDVLTRATGVGVPENRDMAVARYLASGSDGMVADVSPSAANALDVAIQQSGPGADLARDAVASRAGNADAAIVGELDRILGEPEAVSSLVRRNAVETAEARDMAYKAAYAAPMENLWAPGSSGQSLGRLIQQRVPDNISKSANELMRLEGIDPRTVSPVQRIDYITRALNDAAKTGDGAGALGGLTDKGRAYKRLANELRGATKELVPEYAIALDTAATPIARKQALEFGETALGSNTTRDDVAVFLEGASAPEVAAAKEGVRSQIDELRGNVKQLISRPNQDAAQAKAQLDALSSPNAKAKMAMLLGDDDAAALQMVLDESRKALELAANTTRGSQTAGRKFIEQDVQNMTEGGAAGAALSGDVPSALKKIIQSITGRGPEWQQRRKDEVYTAIAKALTSQGPEGKVLLETLGKRVGGIPFSNYSNEKALNVARALLASQQSAPASDQPLFRIEM
jgi:hypothetical protein